MPWATPLPLKMFLSAVHDFFCPLPLALGLITCLPLAPRASKPSTATKFPFVLLRFRNSKVAVDPRVVTMAFPALTPSMALRLRLAPRAVAWEYLGVHFLLSNLARSSRSVASSMNLGLGWVLCTCLAIFAGGLPCRVQRNQGSPHSQVQSFVGRETWHDPHQRGLAKALSWNVVALANLAYSQVGH